MGYPLTPRQKRMARFAPRDERVIFVVIVGLIFAILVLPPLLFLVKGALSVEEGPVTRFTLERFGRILAQRGIWMSAFNSVVFALGSAIVALLILLALLPRLAALSTLAAALVLTLLERAVAQLLLLADDVAEFVERRHHVVVAVHVAARTRHLEIFQHLLQLFE